MAMGRLTDTRGTTFPRTTSSCRSPRRKARSSTKRKIGARGETPRRLIRRARSSVHGPLVSIGGSLTASLDVYDRYIIIDDRMRGRVLLGASLVVSLVS